MWFNWCCLSNVESIVKITVSFDAVIFLVAYNKDNEVHIYEKTLFRICTDYE